MATKEPKSEDMKGPGDDLTAEQKAEIEAAAERDRQKYARFAALCATPKEIVEMDGGMRELLRQVNSAERQLVGALEQMAAAAGVSDAAEIYRASAGAVRQMGQDTRNVAMNHAAKAA